MLSNFSSLSSRVLVLAGMLIGTTLLFAVLHTLSANRFEGHVNAFKTDNIPRVEASYQLEDWSYSILTSVNAFGNARTSEDLRRTYEGILADIVSLEAAASNPSNYDSGVSKLELNRLIEGLKHSLNTTLALKTVALNAADPAQSEAIAPQIALYETILLQDLVLLRTLAVENRAATLAASEADLTNLKQQTEADSKWVFRILVFVLVVTSMIAWRAITRVRIGLTEVSKVLRRQQMGFSSSFFEYRDEFSSIGEKVLHYIEQEKQLRDAQSRAKESELRIEAFEGAIANLTHDLRTPASQISGLLELIEGQQTRDSGPSKEVMMAKAATRRLSSLIQDVLDLTHSEMSNAEPVTSAFEPSELFEELISTFQFTADMRNLELKYENTLTLTSIVQDNHRLQRIVANLIDNAIKYTNQGNVCLSVSNSPVMDGRSKISIEVKDTGIGIPEEQLSDIFDKFSRARNHYAIDGLGLGLALVARFTNMLGGTLSVESKVNEGTCIHIVLPCDVLEAQGEPAPAAIGLKGDGGRPNVLLVDDDPFNLMLASSILEPFAELTCAENGREAVDKAKGAQFDLILMDCRMPVLDGMSATREIRRLEKRRHAPKSLICGLTANASPEERCKAMTAGMDELIAKPLSQNHVQMLLAQG